MAISDFLEEERDALYNQIRKIRDTFGDDKCWMDWNALFAMLPEGYTPPKQDIQIQLEDCKRYLACRDAGTEYIPPPRWIKGRPDKDGLWYIKRIFGPPICGLVLNGWFHGSYTTQILNTIDNIIQSFGPIPDSPIERPLNVC